MSTAWEPATDVFGKRYGEVLLVRLGAAGSEATVYNTFPLNDVLQDDLANSYSLATS